MTLEKAQKVDRAFTIDVLTIDNEFDGRTELATDQMVLSIGIVNVLNILMRL